MSEPTPGQKAAVCAVVNVILIVWFAPMWIAAIVTALLIVAAAASFRFRWRRRR